MIWVSSEGARVETAVAAISEAKPLHLLQSCSTSRPHRGKVETNLAAPDANEATRVRGHDMSTAVAVAEPSANQVRAPGVTARQQHPTAGRGRPELPSFTVAALTSVFRLQVDENEWDHVDA